MTYDELLAKYNDAIKEIELLKKENHELKIRLGNDKDEPFSDEGIISEGINKHSSPEEKIKMFRSLFKGREDVFARRWYSKTTGKSGYQPVCENEWAEGLCDKRKYKCASCPNRKLMPLTDRDIL